MEFTQKKIPKSYLPQMSRIPIATIRPYEILSLPVYIYLKKNEKFVAIKSPFDFFDEIDLKKYEEKKVFFFPPFIEKIKRFILLGKSIKKILKTKLSKENDVPFVLNGLDSPRPYEISDAVMKTLGEILWNKKLENYFFIPLVTSLCDPLPKEDLTFFREKNIDQYELSIHRASMAVFFSLLLGYCDSDFLNLIYYDVFVMSAENRWPGIIRSEIDELKEYVFFKVKDLSIFTLNFDSLGEEKISQKIKFRVNRIVNKKNFVEYSVFGKNGIIHV